LLDGDKADFSGDRKAQPSTVKAEEEKTLLCVECGVEKGNPGVGRSFRCGKCNNLKSRVHRLLKENLSARHAFSVMSKEQKAAWYRDNHEFMGKELAASLNEIAKQITSTESKSMFKGSGLLLDHDDFAEKYKNKPAQLAAVLKNARSFYCPVRETTLFEDTAYNSESLEAETKLDIHEVAISQDRVQKKAKAEAAPKPPKQDVPAGLSPSIKAKLEKMAEECRAWVAEVIALTETVTPGLVTYVSPVAIESAKAFKLAVDGILAELEGALEGNEFEMMEVKEQHFAMKSDFKDVCRHLRDQVKDAEAYVAAALEGNRFSRKRNRKAVEGEAVDQAAAPADAKNPKAKKAKAKAKGKA